MKYLIVNEQTRHVESEHETKAQAQEFCDKLNREADRMLIRSNNLLYRAHRWFQYYHDVSSLEAWITYVNDLTHEGIIEMMEWFNLKRKVSYEVVEVQEGAAQYCV